MSPAEADIRVCVAVGSNIKPLEHISAALEHLDAENPIEGLSAFYWCPAVERTGQPPFLNGACCFRTSQPPRELKFGLLRFIEQAEGRVRTADRHAPRSLDLDIALYGDWVVDEQGLTIPDPEIRTRSFLAVPVAEAWPGATLPDTGEPVRRVAAALDASNLKRDSAFTQQMQQRFLA